MKRVYWIVVLGVICCGQAFAAKTAARPVSRANCMVPMPHISPVGFGWTFNESISWDPLFRTDHRVFLRSDHYTSARTAGIWRDRKVGSYTAGDGYYRARSWRFWAGTVEKGDKRMPHSFQKPYKWVVGNHWELLDGSRAPVYRYSQALDCQLTNW